MKAFEELKARAGEVWRRKQDPALLRITVALGSCGLATGAEQTRLALEQAAGRHHGAVSFTTVGCLGACFAEPLVAIALPGESPVVYGPVTADDAAELLEGLLRGEQRRDRALGVLADAAQGDLPPLAATPFFAAQERRLLVNCGVIDPDQIDDAVARGAYEGLNRALGEMTPEDVIGEVSRSELGGRGGAYFPTGRKWQFLRGARAVPKYILCNADEGDPGAFVNRITMESDPHSLLEGILIAAYATGSEKAYVYIRSEYPVAVAQMRRAVAQARECGLLGEGILGSGFSCDVEVVMGAGAYVCGEETGLIASIQDMRGMPLVKPPFPAERGLFGQPSNVNNVETYANVPLILRHGADWWRAAGVDGMRGTKLFSLSGDIQRPGVVEVPFGISLRRIVDELGGGVPEGRRLKAVQSGGPLSGFVPAELADLPVERDGFTKIGTLVGSGGLVILDDSRCIVDTVRMYMAFCRDESCGRCTTCRVGTMRLVDIVDRVAAGRGKPSDFDNVESLNRFMQDANCVHGQFSPMAIMSALRHYRPEWDAHLRERVCATGVCEDLVRYEIDPQACTACALCEPVCPTDVISREGSVFSIEQNGCIRCGACLEICPDNAVRVVPAFAAERTPEMAGAL